MHKNLPAAKNISIRLAQEKDTIRWIKINHQDNALSQSVPINQRIYRQNDWNQRR